MTGEKVIIKAYGNEPIVGRVWEADQDVVYICSNENFEKLARNDEALRPVGFFRTDVFFYDEALLGKLMKQYKKNPSAWGQLKVWDGDQKGNRKETVI